MKKPVVIGILAGSGLFLAYFLILSLANSFGHALSEFRRMALWIEALAVGFGIQVGLYAYIRKALKAKKMAGCNSSVAATGSISTGSMVACCAHHLADILPFVGLSATAIFFAKYQQSFLLAGVLSNAIGILLMLDVIQSRQLYQKGSGLAKVIFAFNMKKILYFAIPLGTIAVIMKFGSDFMGIS